MMILALALAAMFAMPQDYTVDRVMDEYQNPIELRRYEAEAAKAPYLLIVQDIGNTLEQWDDIAMAFRNIGYNVVLFALPGHGKEQVPHYRLSNYSLADSLDRTQKIIDHLKARGAKTVHLLGTGFGANVAMSIATDNEDLKVVAISPGLIYRGQTLTKEMAKNLPGRLMIVASQEDTYSNYSIEIFDEAAEKEFVTQLYSNIGHGIWILKRLPESLITISLWLNQAD
jgi:alpha-beta hydrolase superfamily lysophospholipase